MARRLSLFRMAVLLAAALISAAPEALGAGRVVAVGDIHGSYEGAVEILSANGLIDADGRWIGGETTLVQTGDILDRGGDVRAVMDLLIRLQGEAAAAGGRVIVLLGNHETMNVLGIFRDVGADAFASFADDQSETRRTQAYKQFEKFYTRLGRKTGQAFSLGKETREKWLELHPPGFVEYAEAMTADGVYGRWLRSQPVAVVIDGTLFLHGGYGPLLRGTSIDELNRRVAEEMQAFDRLRERMLADKLILPWHSVLEMKREAEREIEAFHARGEDHVKRRPERARQLEALEPLLGWNDWWLVHADGPVWWRGAARWDEQEKSDEMAELLDGAGVERMVVGHTVQNSASITMRFEGRVFLIDTGMLAAAYNGRPSALEISDGTISAVYADERVVLVGGADAPE
jgi:hypothetical protein